MEDLVRMVAQKVGISEAQARQAVETVAGFLKDRLPEPIGSQVAGMLGTAGGGLAGGLGDVAGSIGGMFGGTKE